MRYLVVVLFFSLSLQICFAQKTNKKNDIKFIESVAEFATIDEFLALPQFKNKTVYIDLWGTTCIPCIREFQFAERTKKELRNKNVDFLYISVNTQGAVNNEWRRKWKDMVLQYKLSGTHIYVYVIPPNKFVHEAIDFDYFQKHQNEAPSYGIPRYFIAKDGKIIVYDAFKPSEIKKLVKQIDSVNILSSLKQKP